VRKIYMKSEKKKED